MSELKLNLLDKVTKGISMCSICRVGTIGKSVPGEGSANAEVVFVGEAPGKTEAITGRPFVGKSGKLLRKLIAKIGLSENEIFITSVLKYLPKKGIPNISQIKHGRIHLFQQLKIIKPKIVVLLGATACKAIFQRNVSIHKMHGELIEGEGGKFFITFHPAAALRLPKTLPLLEKDFYSLQAILA